MNTLVPLLVSNVVISIGLVDVLSELIVVVGGAFVVFVGKMLRGKIVRGKMFTNLFLIMTFTYLFYEIFLS